MRIYIQTAKIAGCNSLLMFPILALVLLVTWNNHWAHARPFELTGKDNFDKIMEKFMSVTPRNCKSKPITALRLDNQLKKGVISQVPRYNNFLSTIYYNNRSNLLHAHNIALNRAFYYSYIYQALNMSEALKKQPGFEYIYFSLAADVSGGVGMINGSGIFFDSNCTYANWYSILRLNQTLPLFAPRSWRADDYNEPTNWLREPTNNTIDIVDLGSGRGRNYTISSYKNNPWYDLWLPDLTSKADTLRKFTYSVRIRKTPKDSHLSNFFGPPQPTSQEKFYLPVLYTDPYFDCGRSNKWIVSATAPVVEFMPRYSNSTHLRRARYVAVTSADLEFEKIDFNPCPLSEGNPAPNYFANTARCKKSTLCEPLSGFGFRRGGYQCACLPGFRYPWWHDGPFLGIEIESATKKEYEDSFDCFQTDFAQVIPKEMPTFSGRKKRFADYSYDNEKEKFLRTVFPDNFESHRMSRSDFARKPFLPLRRYAKKKTLSRKKRDLFDNQLWQRMTKIIQRKENVNKANCKSKKPNELLLPGDAGYGAEKQFESQGRTALRLAHFLSNFLQNVDEYEEFGILRGDRRLHQTQMYGEVIANVMGDFKILGSGIFFDRFKFLVSPINKDPNMGEGNALEYFAPFAYKIRKRDSNNADTTASAIDFAGFNESYSSKRWFLNMKTRWATNFHSLEKFTTRPMIRSDINGTSSIRFEYYPLTYYATKYEDGEWLRPVFKCDDRVDSWVLTYVVPFFGKNSLKTSIEFKGVVTVDVDLENMGINQCPTDFYVANAFKNTAHCDFETTYCVPLQSHLKYKEGAYKCECKQGYEYPFNDLQWYFDGQTMVEEYSKMSAGKANRFETLRCRIAGATHYRLSWILLFTTLLLLKFL